MGHAVGLRSGSYLASGKVLDISIGHQSDMTDGFFLAPCVRVPTNAGVPQVIGQFLPMSNRA
jgi:hypothetical protein